MSSALDTAPPPDERTIFGHPRGLYVLFFAELWERFCYYGMRALLVFYVADQFHKTQAEASLSFGAFTALVYALGTFGGYVADRLLGYRRSIILGGVIMALGLFLMMVPQERLFLYGLATIIVGNGLFKPNISTLVGKLYPPNDPRRDGGFTIFYMGINLGALIAPIACQQISVAMGTDGHPDYRYGFLAAGLGVLLGVVCLGFGSNLLKGQGLPPENRRGFGTLGLVTMCCAVVVPCIYLLLDKKDWTGNILIGLGSAIGLYLLYIAFQSEKVTRQRMMVLVLLLLCNITFWMCFEQAGNSLSFFARDHIEALKIGGWSMPFEWFQSVNSTFIVMLGPIFAALWVTLARRNLNPSIPAKFGLGLIQVALGFAFLIWGIANFNDAGKIPWYLLTGLYLIHTCGELCISPVGLSMVTKLAPEKIVGMVMGAWFMTIAIGNFLAGKVSEEAGAMIDKAIEQKVPLAERIDLYSVAFTPILYTALVIGIVLVVLSPWINKWMHGVK